MKIKSYTLAAVLLVANASVSGATTWGELPRGSSRSDSTSVEAASPEQLASLAADLARTAAKLAEVRQAQNIRPDRSSFQAVFDAEAAQRFSRKATRNETGSTVRWLGTQFKDATIYKPAQQVRTEVEMPTILSVSSESPIEETGFSFASDQTTQSQPRAQAFSPRSRVMRAQANKAPYQTARALQNGIPEPAEGATPQSVVADESDLGNIETWNEPVYSDDICAGGCDVQCDPGCGCARCGPRRRTIVAGTEAVFLAPEINGNRVSYVFEEYGNNPSTSHYGPGADNAAVNDFYIAPRLWVGVQGECWGIVGRYFHMRAGENDHNASIPANRNAQVPIYDQGYDANSLFEAYYADIELTRNFCLHGCKNQFSFGVRYADIEHHESVVGMAEIAQGLLNGGARANRRAYGTGLTFGLNGRKPLFCNSCAHWFYNVRSSVLWGRSKNETETWSEAIVLGSNVDAIAGSKTGAATGINEDMFIGEVQAGLEWDFALRCLPAKSFFRLAFEYQYWDSSIGHAGSGAYSGFSVTGDQNSTATAIATTLADAPGLQVDLYGFHVGTGFTW